jgi:hypothetical protein
MSRQDDLFNPLHIQELMNILGQRIDIISSFGMIGFTMPAAGERQHVKFVGEAWGKVIKDVCIAAQASQEKKHIAIPAPVQVMQVDPVDGDKITSVWRTIHFSFLLWKPKVY